MAENEDQERTEEPTQKKLDDALKRGDVVKSHEVSTWFVLAGATLVLIAFSGNMGSALNTTMRGLIANASRIPSDGGGIARLAQTVSLDVLAACAIPFLLLLLAAIAGNAIQHRFVWSAEALAPKLSKISPLAGLKRLFSKQALANFVKGIAKIVLIGALMAFLFWPKRDRLEGLVLTDVGALLPLMKSLSLELLGAAVGALAIVAALDYFFQYRQWHARQRMSLQEMKEEFKQTEGDPAIKARIRRLREMRMRKRMMAAVPKASVIITNPTHYAVALKYEQGDNAPLCVAKGADAVALRIREVANAHSIPIVENPPLARALHAAVDVDDEIPPEHYKAVAEVIGYVMRLRRGLRP